MGRARGGQHGPWCALLSHFCGLLALISLLGIPLLAQRFWPGLAYGVLKVVAFAAQPRSCHCPVDANVSSSKRRDAIILLVQKKRMGMLVTALASLHAHFNDCFRKDVLLFHNGDFMLEDQLEVTKKFPLVQFHYLEVGGKYWRVPPALENSAPWKSTKGYSEGYRHMCRFHYKMAFEYLSERGYQWFMRMDDDSYILSCIEYDMFQFLEDNDIFYAWRLAQLEYREFAETLPELVDSYVREHRTPLSIELSSHYEGGKLSTESWDRWTYYNNFMMTRISWWRSKHVSQWLDKVDSSGIAYLHRVGDAPIQTFTRMMFMHKKHVHHFQDWTYNHGPVIGLSLSSILPTALRSMLLDDGKDLEWVGGLYDMSEYSLHGPVLQKVNRFLRTVLQVQLR